MKQLLPIIVFFFFFGLTPQAFAETSVTIEGNGEGASSDVRVESSTGESTVCVNGQCETKRGENSTTVCINGTCETTQGTVERQEGGARVKVENDSTPVPTATPTPTITPTPTKEAGESAKKKSVQTESTSDGQKDWIIMISNFGRFVVSWIL